MFKRVNSSHFAKIHHVLVCHKATRDEKGTKEQPKYTKSSFLNELWLEAIEINLKTYHIYFTFARYQETCMTELTVSQSLSSLMNTVPNPLLLTRRHVLLLQPNKS